MMDNLPSNIRDPMCFSYFGDIKLAYIEFNEYNANESFRVRKVCKELSPDGKSLYFVTIYKERYNVSDIVKRDLPSIYYGGNEHRSDGTYIPNRYYTEVL